MISLKTNHTAKDLRLLTLPQTARELGVSLHAVRCLTRQGTLPMLHVGCRMRVPAGALQNWISESIQKTAAESRLVDNGQAAFTLGA